MTSAIVLDFPDGQVWRLLGLPIPGAADESTAPPVSEDDGQVDSETLEIFLL